MKMTRGFTIVELLITMAIIGILSAIAIPSVGGWLERSRLRKAAVDLVVAVQQARMYAVKNNRNIVFTLDPDGNGSLEGAYAVFVDNGRSSSTFWTREPDEFMVTRGSLPSGVKMIKASFAGGVPRTRFNTMGFPNGFGGHVYLNNSSDQYMGIHVNINGNPRIVRSVSGEAGTWE